jgi:hypothetical protein
VDIVQAREFAARMIPRGLDGCELFYAEVISEDGDGTCSVYLMGDGDSPLSGIRRLRMFTIAPGQVVALLKKGTDFLIIGYLAMDDDEDWQVWTPQVDQGATTNVAKTTDYARWRKLGRVVEMQGRLTITGAGTLGSNIVITNLPYPIFNTLIGIMGVFSYIKGGAHYKGIAVADSVSGFRGIRSDTTITTSIGTDPSVALANADIIRFNVSYEAG